MRKWIPPLLILAATLVSVLMYPKLPDQAAAVDSGAGFVGSGNNASALCVFLPCVERRHLA